jgi:hypothetical protein
MAYPLFINSPIIKNPKETIEQLRNAQCEQTIIVEDEYNWSLGEIYSSRSINLQKAKEILPNFYRALENAGYRTRECQSFTSTQLLIAPGFIESHTDDRMGLVALMLIDIQPFTDSSHHNIRYSIGEFRTSNRVCEMHIGEMIIFNASNIHSWGSNGNAFFFSQTVSKCKTV